MRVLYIDIDSLRPDHLGCYGYHRNTSPNIDRIAAEGVRFDNCYASDAPCLPSRSALFSGRCGFHTGVINHGGVASQPFIEGEQRSYKDLFGLHSWPAQFRNQGYHTVTVSPFGERHSAWHWYAGFNEVYNTGKVGMENADEVWAEAEGWFDRRGKDDNWFMHLNFWDPHTPYRVPTEYGNPFEDSPAPDWLDEATLAEHWKGCGPHSAREMIGYGDEWPEGTPDYPRQPGKIDSLEAAKRVFDGYDTGVRYADDYVGKVLDKLESLGVLEDTAIIISADHGENLGELNIYGDHHTADHITCRVPLIIRWPGVTDSQQGRIDPSLIYHFDFAATAVELAGGEHPECWDGQSFASAFCQGQSQGRESLVTSQAAWCVQRAVRWDKYLYLRTYHDSWHDFPDEMLFDIENDPHETRNLAAESPELLAQGRDRLEQWKQQMLETATHPVDPLDTVMAEGGSLHAISEWAGKPYLQRLMKSGREDCARRLAAKHGVDLEA